MNAIELSPGYDAQCSYCDNYGYVAKMDSSGNIARYCMNCVKNKNVAVENEMLDVMFGNNK